jgi:hypothetical protein
MSRISKSDVYGAFERAAANIVSANSDPKSNSPISRADVKAKLKDLSGTEKSMTDMFYRFVDHRDHREGARVTRSDVSKALAYAKEHMVDSYDKNNNGLSRGEISKMSNTAKLAVKFSQEQKASKAG